MTRRAWVALLDDVDGWPFGYLPFVLRWPLVPTTASVCLQGEGGCAPPNIF